MLPEIEIDIDKNVVIPCAMVDFQIRRAFKFCPECPCFKGVGIMCQGDKVEVKDENGLVVGERPIEWHEKYIIRCNHIIERRVHMIPKIIEE